MRLPRTTDRRSQFRRLTRTPTRELCRRTDSAGLRWPRRWFSPPAEPTYACGKAPMAFGCGSVPIGTPPRSSPEAPGMSLGARHDRAPGLSGEGQTTAAIASISSSVYLQGGHATDATRLGIHDGRPGGVPCDARFNAGRRGRGQARQPGALSTTVAQGGYATPRRCRQAPRHCWHLGTASGRPGLIGLGRRENWLPDSRVGGRPAGGGGVAAF